MYEFIFYSELLIKITLKYGKDESVSKPRIRIMSDNLVLLTPGCYPGPLLKNLITLSLSHLSMHFPE